MNQRKSDRPTPLTKYQSSMVQKFLTNFTFIIIDVFIVGNYYYYYFIIWLVAILFENDSNLFTTFVFFAFLLIDLFLSPN